MTYNGKVKKVYFGFYDQLLNPYRQAAKDAWDFSFVMDDNPSSLENAIFQGFSFSKNKEIKWMKVHSSIKSGELTYLKKPNNDLGATEEQINSYLVYLVVDGMGKEKLSKKNILKRAKSLRNLLR